MADFPLKVCGGGIRSEGPAGRCSAALPYCGGGGGRVLTARRALLPERLRERNRRRVRPGAAATAGSPDRKSATRAVRRSARSRVTLMLAKTRHGFFPAKSDAVRDIAFSLRRSRAAFLERTLQRGVIATRSAF